MGEGSIQIAGGSDTINPSISVILGTKAFGLTPSGGGIANFWNTSGADYAEYFEWKDQNQNSEDRIGLFVTMDETDPEKIRIASEGDEVIGVVSAISGVIGDTAELYWKNAAKKDEFGRNYIYLDYRPNILNLLTDYDIKFPENFFNVDLISLVFEENKLTYDGKNFIEPVKEYIQALQKTEADPLKTEADPLKTEADPLKTEADPLKTEADPLKTPVLVAVNTKQNISNFNLDDLDNVKPIPTTISNPDFDKDREYIPRSARKEWATVGLLGKLLIRDNGECIPGKKCSVGNGGLAIPGNDYRVLSRINKNVVKILFK